MSEKPTALERAFMLAKSGHMNAVSDIRRQLLAERYDASQIQGPHLLKQLRGLIAAARTGSQSPNHLRERLPAVGLLLAVAISGVNP